MKRQVLPILILALTSGTAHAWNIFLKPSDFSDLPKSVKAELERENCLIPQSNKDSGYRNVVQGEFAKKGQIDWAVLCYIKKEDISFVKVIWGGKVQCQGRVDKVFHGGSSTWQNYITAEKSEQLKYYDVPAPNHDGLEFHIGGEGSTAYYCHDSKWQGYGTGD